MLFVKLEVGWVDHPKIIEAGVDGAGLHAITLCLAKRAETDGWLHRSLLARYGATPDLLDRLVTVGLLDVEGDRYRPCGWLDRNPSQGAIDASRASKSDAGKRGNHKRHGHPVDYDDCPICHPESRSSQGAIAEPRTCETPPRPETETETETSLLSSQSGLTTDGCDDVASHETARQLADVGRDLLAEARRRAS